ncbi:MAG: DNA mismatch repair endonuclease MutL [Tannerella sp.]|jgi:DNA mismatch repair protein MutL|nr:DNA mismatch repair endonuclease MutL [Tannerella sp.]
MSDVIHLLPDHIANQIAAGEVIQSAASVVKELTENAIDADAHRIAVHIKDAGRTLIQVVDDGKGMSETDARMAFERHATSKITDARDLFHLHTMGFRGEALASIAAVAQVELRTRLRGAELGTKMAVAGSALDHIEPDACAEGSVFSVKNLFYNVPARRRFLKSNETELRNIIREFERVALVNPHIAFVLKHHETEILNLPVSGLRQRIIHVFGKKFNQKLLTLEVANAIVNIEGYIGHTDTVKRKGYLNFFFVNGRYMRHPYFHKAVVQAYEPLVPAGEIPDYFIYLTLDPSTIDVNIHPTKTEIKFENERHIWQIIASAVRETLGKAHAVPSIDFDMEKTLDIPVYNPAGAVSPPQLHVDHRYNPFRTEPHPAAEQNWEKLYRGFEHERDATSAHSPEIPAADEPATDENADRPLFQHVAASCFQYRNRYIITPLKSGLVLVDQRRAHIRILYEQYMANMHLRKSVSQKILFPEIAELTPSEAAILPVVEEELQQLGFELSPMGNNCYAINGLPAGVQDCHPAALLKEIIGDIMERGAGGNDRKAEMLALSLAKTAAIKNGKTLTVEEMESIVAALFSLGANSVTPDGKTVMSILTDDELAKRFR